VGYKVHITETCEDDLPHLITHIETTPGPTADGAATPEIHAALEQRGLLPGPHRVDTGFLDADLLVESQEYYGVNLLGPMRLDYHWQAREGAGFDVQHFQIDWDQHHATCPAGKTSTGWTPAVDNRGNAVIKVKFSTTDCRRCDHVAQCIRSKKLYPRRTLTIRPQKQYQALQAAWQRESTEAFQAEYARRAGIEGTISRGTRSTRLRRTRYIGLARVHLGHILTAVGAERTPARRVVPGDRACQDPYYAVRPADGRCPSRITREHFASSHHDRWSPPRMHMWENFGCAAGPEVVFDRGAPSLTRRRTRSPGRPRQRSPLSTHVRI
jgi:Transposase DDE domain